MKQNFRSRQSRADYVARRLARLYHETPIPLDHWDPYTLLVAVLLSAQCTDKRVNTVTPSLWALAATPQAMAEVPVEKIQQVIRPCRPKRRGRSGNFRACSSNATAVSCRGLFPNWKLCPGWATRRRRW